MLSLIVIHHQELQHLVLFVVGLAYHQGSVIKAREIIGSALDPSAQVSNNILTVKELLAPLAREEVKLVRCLGLNYADHAVRPISFRNSRVQAITKHYVGGSKYGETSVRLTTYTVVMR